MRWNHRPAAPLTRMTNGQERVAAQLDNDTVRFLAENTDLSPRQAEELVRKHGDDRSKLLELAKTMKAES